MKGERGGFCLTGSDGLGNRPVDTKMSLARKMWGVTQRVRSYFLFILFIYFLLGFLCHQLAHQTRQPELVMGMPLKKGVVEPDRVSGLTSCLHSTIFFFVVIPVKFARAICRNYQTRPICSMGPGWYKKTLVKTGQNLSHERYVLPSVSQY